jgi:hypothetical protein
MDRRLFPNSSQSSLFISSSAPFPMSFTRDNSFNTAKFVGTLRASSVPTTLRVNGKLNRNDRVDFFRIDVAPGATFSTQIDSGTIRGGRIRSTSYVQVPGQSLTKVQTEVYRPGFYSRETNVPFVNNLGFTLRIYTEVRNLTNKTVRYNSQSLFR